MTADDPPPEWIISCALYDLCWDLDCWKKEWCLLLMAWIFSPNLLLHTLDYYAGLKTSLLWAAIMKTWWNKAHTMYNLLCRDICFVQKKKKRSRFWLFKAESMKSTLGIFFCFPPFSAVVSHVGSASRQPPPWTCQKTELLFFFDLWLSVCERRLCSFSNLILECSAVVYFVHILCKEQAQCESMEGS